MSAVSPVVQPEHDAAEVRERADEILERSEYTSSESLGELLGRKVSELFDWFADGLAGPGSAGGGVLGWLAWLVLVLMVAAAVVLLVRALVTGRLTGPSVRRRRPGDGVVVAGPERPPADWLREAEEHEAAGRWRQGVLCRYRALVSELVARRVVSEAVGRTTGELRREADAHLPPTASEAFAEASSLFDEVWYGGAESGVGERDRLVSQSHSVLSAPRSEPAGAAGDFSSTSEVAR